MYLKSLFGCCWLLCGVLLFAQDASEWPAYGRDPGGTKYSPLGAVWENTPIVVGSVQAIQGQMMDMIEVPYWDGNTAHPFPSVKVRMDFRGADIGDFVRHTGRNAWVHDPRVMRIRMLRGAELLSAADLRPTCWVSKEDGQGAGCGPGVPPHCEGYCLARAIRRSKSSKCWGR